LETFVKQRPDSDAASSVAGRGLLGSAGIRKAAEAYRRASELDPDDVEIKKRRLKHSSSRQVGRTAKLYDEIAKAEPDDGLALLRLGQIYRRQMKYDRARQNLQKAAMAFPDSVEVQFNIVLLDRDEGKLEMR
jgi:tetratricopeptide (TPR) repeat protein